MKTKRLMVILLMSLAVPVPCWAVVGQMTKLEDEQVSMAPLLTDYVDMIHSVRRREENGSTDCRLAALGGYLPLLRVWW